MMIPEFMRFYSYTLTQTLNEYAVAFFSLINSMYRLQAREQIRDVVSVSAGMSGKDGQSILDELKKQERGLHGVVEEVRVAKGIKK
jgi:hypothetical protein